MAAGYAKFSTREGALRLRDRECQWCAATYACSARCSRSRPKPWLIVTVALRSISDQ
jgi:hypothetical protein